jgi:nucleotide-binding universal stress UspA family protein
MGAYQTVVVAADGSETSPRAVDRAEELARHTPADALIVHTA